MFDSLLFPVTSGEHIHGG